MEKPLTYIVLPKRPERSNSNATEAKNFEFEVSDEVLWQQFQKGRESAFAKIYKDNVGRLYSYGKKLVKDDGLVEDAIQDMFVELWDARERLGAVKSIKSYLYMCIRRKLLLKVSVARKTNSQSTLESLQKITPSYEISLIEKQQFDAAQMALQKAMTHLNGKQMEIIHLKFYSKLSYNEIADIMQLEKKGVYNLIARTLLQLRSHLKPEFLIAFLLLQVLQL